MRCNSAGGLSVSPSSMGAVKSRKSVSSTSSSTSMVKETHYVHVEYDPITRKRILNTYEILKDLGYGQHGKVKLARDIDTGQLVAIKIVDRASKPGLGRLTRRGSLVSQEDKIRREIAIMKKCCHPHIVKLIEVLDSETSRKIYLILEYLEKGEILWQRRDSSTDEKPEPFLTVKQAKCVFRDVVSGLEYLHNQGIIHRDIKPSNLLINKDDVVKISDFGISFAANLDGNGLSDDFELAKTAGTPAFLAPELCTTDGDDVRVTYKIDIWALGVTLYCVLFGQLPFSGETEFQLFDAINNAPLCYPNMEEWRVSPKIPEHDFVQIKDLLSGLLERDPTKRTEIERIKRHPFFLEGLVGKQYEEYISNWRNDMKIDVTNQEMDDAVIGIGTRIRKKISKVLGFSAHSHSHLSSGSSPTQSRIVHLKHVSSSSPSSSTLKTDRSYIFSEALKSSNESQISLQRPHSQVHISPSSLRNQQANISKFTESTDESSETENANDVEDTLVDHEQDDNLSLSDHSSMSSTDAKVVFSASPNISVNASPNNAQPPSAACSQTSSISETDDTETARPHIPGGEKRRVPSFASLNSYYDDGYMKNLTSGNGQTSAQPLPNFTTGAPNAQFSNIGRISTSTGSRKSSRSTLDHYGSFVPMTVVHSAISIPEYLKPTDMDPIAPSLTNEYYSSIYGGKKMLKEDAKGKMRSTKSLGSSGIVSSPAIGHHSVTFSNDSGSERNTDICADSTSASKSDASLIAYDSSKPAILDRAAIYGKKIPLTLRMKKPMNRSSSSSSSSSSSGDEDDNGGELMLTVRPRRHPHREEINDRSQSSQHAPGLSNVPE
ncbi:hypothetical protein FOA43_001383 [Brettanomyces nanus]|uniref:non-specific serine/threonine protein kinase n=1 Tax=Eeniella nana TaxID=13502 RepID=A0A875S1U0_EENNA|nr:uncharacterized protein FOA43_001383 [Brettanomyces nanus]QPG74062.1 hypothetical protein FOA43_001383 [Brettanomyces nanus]